MEEAKAWWITSLLEGAEKGYEEAIAQLGQSQRLIPKRLLVIVVPEKLVPKTVKTIISVNKTGKSGDGKIFVMPVERFRQRATPVKTATAALDEV